MKFLSRATLVALSIASSVAPLAHADAQRPVPVRPDARVRVKHHALPSCARIGRVIAVEGDSVRVEVPYPAADARNSPVCSTLAQTVVPLRAVEVSLGVHRRGWRAVRQGALIGGAAGAVIGYTSGEDDPDGWLALSRSDLAMIGGMAGMANGAVIGGVVGLIGYTERWAPASRASIVMIPDPARRRVGFTASFSF